MGSLLHVCLYNAEPETSKELTDAICGLNFVRLEAEVSSVDELVTLLHQTAINLVFFHLDPDTASVVEVIEQVSTRFPEVAMIGVSHQTGPQAILAPMRAGCDQFVCEPIDLSDLATAVSRVAAKRFMMHPKSRRICVTGASGGVGTTSIACNLALEIGDLTGKDCALVDLDLQFGDVAMNFDCDPKYNLYDLGAAGLELDHAILGQALEKLPCKVAVLSRPEMVEQHEHVTPDTVHRAIELLMSNYENIILDVPRHLHPVSMAAFTSADMIFIVAQLVVPSIRNAKRYYDALLRMGLPEERIEFVVNRGDKQGTGRITVKDLEETVKKPVFACIPNDYQFVARSIDFGRPIAALDRNSPVRTAIRKMGMKITSERGTKRERADDDRVEKKGLLKRFLTK